MQFANTQKLYLGSFYRPPRAPLEQLEQLEQSLTDIHTRFTHHHPNIIMAGDFNATDISWDSGTVTGNSDSINARKLIGIVEQFGLTQHQMNISRPASNAVLDLVFSTNPNLVNKVEVVPGMSDHLSVLTTLDVRPKPYIKAPHKVHLYKRGNFDSLREDMSNMSQSFLLKASTRSTNENWTVFKESLTDAIKKHIPTRISKRKRELPWINPEIYRKARRSKDKHDWTTYCHHRQHTQKLLRTAHDTYIRDVIGASLLDGGNQKKFWSFVKLNKTENMGIPILSDDKGLHITDQAKSKALNRQFVSVFTHDDGRGLPDEGPSPYQNMDDIHFTQPGIEKLLLNIKPSKAAGPDELPARVLKEVGREISAVLAFIFQQSYEEGATPEDWSSARISSIYKKGAKSTPSN